MAVYGPFQLAAATSPQWTGLSTTAGNALVAVFAVRTGSTGNLTAVTDDGGNTWVEGPTGYVSGSNTRVEIWYVTNAAAITSITATLSASLAATLVLYELTGIAAVSALDASVGYLSNAPTITNPSAGPITTTNANDVLIAGLAYAQNTPTTVSVSGGFTADASVGAGSTSFEGIATASQVVSSAGTYEAVFTLSAVATAGGATIALKQAAGSVKNGVASLSAVGTLTANGRKVVTRAATVSADSTLTASARKIVTRAASLSADSTLTANRQKIVRRSAALTTTTFLNPNGRWIVTARVIVSAASMELPTPIATGAAVISATATLSGQARRVQKALSALTAQATLSAVATRVVTYVPIGGLLRVEGTDDSAIMRTHELLLWEMTRENGIDVVLTASKAATIDNSSAEKASDDMPPATRVAGMDSLVGATKTSTTIGITLERTPTEL